ncbi:MAG: hypothetical protein OHK0047_15750 [Leptolyngbyaceae cyanobacterium]
MQARTANKLRNYRRVTSEGIPDQKSGISTISTIDFDCIGIFFDCHQILLIQHFSTFFLGTICR